MGTPHALEYATSSLVKWVAICAAFSVGSISIVASGGISESSHGPSSSIVRLLGPGGTQCLFLLFAAATIFLGVAYLRILLSGKRIAICAHHDCLEVVTLLGRHALSWSDVRDVELVTVKTGRRTSQLLMVKRNGQRDLTVPTLAIRGGPPAVAEWIASYKNPPSSRLGATRSAAARGFGRKVTRNS